jgi:Flp pilus assembly protein TadG
MSSLMIHAARPRRRERGASIVEFALILPLLLVVSLAAVDFGRAFFAKNILAQAAREGVRMRVVGTAGDSAGIRIRVMDITKVAGLTLKVLTIDPPDVDRQIRVTVGADFNWLTPGLFNLFGAGFTNPVRLTGEAWMRNESPS